MTHARPVEWRVSKHLTDYATALAEMDARATAVAEHRAPELVWLLEHPPLYTAGTSAEDRELIEARFPVHKVGRGGQFTYHGPGQRVVYVMLDLNRRTPDVRAFVATLEEWIIRTLARFGDKEPLVLFLAGWAEYPFPDSEWAAHQASVALQPPILERRGPDGKWATVLADAGFPAGLPRMMTIDLTGKLTGPRCVLRLRTNMMVFWDQIFVAPVRA